MEQETKHTPGPLLFKGDEIYQEASGRTLARLCGYGTPADGVLFAAAPALLAALQRIMNAHNSGNNGAFMGEAVVCRAFADEANEAIRAAKGGAS